MEKLTPKLNNALIYGGEITSYKYPPLKLQFFAKNVQFFKAFNG